MKEITLKITGMHCNGCANNITQLLQSLEGVENTSVSLSAGIANIRFDETQISPAQLIEAIEDAGFDATE